MDIERYAFVKIRDRDVPTMFLVSLIVLLAFLAIHLIQFTIGGSLGEVQNDYYPAANAMMNGHAAYIPYNDLSWEYPPLAFFVLFIPRLFVSDPFGYQIAFGIEMYLFYVLSMVILCKLARRFGKSENMVLFLFLILTISMFDFIYERFDVVPAALCLVAVYFYAEKKYEWAFFILAAATMIKIYPGILFLAFLVPLAATDRWKMAFKSTAVFIFSAGLFTLPFFLMASNDVTSFLTYHSVRGIQIESVASSIILVMQQMGLTEVFTVNNYGSFNLAGNLPDTLSPYMMFIMIIAILFSCYIQFIIMKSRTSDANEMLKSAMIFSMISLMMFIIFNKVLSAQYIIWITPVAITAYIAIDDMKKAQMSMMIYVFAAFTTFLFAYVYHGFCVYDPFSVAVLFARNVLLVILLVYLIFGTTVFGDFVRSLKAGNRMFSGWGNSSVENNEGTKDI